jgi:hypothetical protein
MEPAADLEIPWNSTFRIAVYTGEVVGRKRKAQIRTRLAAITVTSASAFKI